MPSLLTEITEITTALGTLTHELAAAVANKPVELENVSSAVWDRVVNAYNEGAHVTSFQTAFLNGRSLLNASHGLRGRHPMLVEWKGPHHAPGEDTIPADLRIDHVYLVSCKYLSKVLLNTGPARLFDRLLVGEDRSSDNWFAATAPAEFQRFFLAARTVTELTDLPDYHFNLTREQQFQLKGALSERTLPAALQPPWLELCQAVSHASVGRWAAAASTPRLRLRLLWRLLRVSDTTYYILGTDKETHLRLRIMSAWDWNQAYRLRSLNFGAEAAGQPEVRWTAIVETRVGGELIEVAGHIEVRWSHGRFVGAPEAKVYLDSLHTSVPGYEALD